MCKNLPIFAHSNFTNMEKIIQVQKCNGVKDMCTICVSDLLGKDKNIVKCPISCVGMLIVANL